MSTTAAMTDLPRLWRDVDSPTRAALDAEVYATLKRMARGRLAGGGPATLNPTALVHEAVARLLGGGADASSRAHFYALAALQMRAVLVDHARRRHADKRGGGAVQVTLDDEALVGATGGEDFLDLHEALDVLAREDARCARAVELTYFGGLNAQELAAVLEVSVATVERDLNFGRAWLRRNLGR